MKKLYSISLSLFIAAAAVGQNKTSKFKTLRSKPAKQVAISAPNPKSSNKSAAVIFSEDFTTDPTSTWTLTDNNSSGVNWYWSPDGSSLGDYAGTMSSNGSTASTGCIVFDSDYNNGTNGSVGGEDASITSPAISCAGRPYVALKFNEFFRQYALGLGTVSISNDGTTFTDVYSIDATTKNPQGVAINITSIAGNQATVYIRFTWTGDWDYYWFVDDIIVEDLAGNDLVMNTRNIVAETNLDTYTKIPLQHVDKISLDANVTNYGYIDQPNTIYTAKINDGSSDVYTYSSTPATMTTGTTIDFTSSSNYYTPSALGNYTTSFSIVSDSTDANPSNNSLPSIDFEITDGLYARDNGDDATADDLGTYSFTSSGSADDGFCMLNLFEFAGQDTIESVSIKLLDVTGAGGTFATGAIVRGFAIWESQTAGSFPASLDVPFLTDDYTIQAGDEGNWITLPFTNFSGNTVTADASFADSSIYAGIQIDGSTLGGGDIGVYDDETTFQASTSGMIYLGATNNSFYTNGNAFFIRLNMKRGSTGVNENIANNLRVKQNQPNPAKASSIVNYELEKASNVSIQVTDLAGKVVFSQSYGVKAAGRNSIELNTSDLGAGVYFYTLKADDESITKKMSVIK